MTRFVLAFCLVRSQWSGKVYLGVHYADVRAPECTGQASGSQVGGCRGQGKAMCVPVQIAGQRTSVLSGCLPNWLVGSATRSDPWDAARQRDLRVPSANLELSDSIFKPVHCWSCPGSSLTYWKFFREYRSSVLQLQIKKDKCSVKNLCLSNLNLLLQCKNQQL